MAFLKILLRDVEVIVMIWFNKSLKFAVALYVLLLLLVEIN